MLEWRPRKVDKLYRKLNLKSVHLSDLKHKKWLIVEIGFFFLIMILYLIAAFLTFGEGSRLGWLLVFFLTIVGGLAVFWIGYASVIGLGGKSSLNLFDNLSRFNGSKHLIKMQETIETPRNLAIFPSILYMSPLIFLIAMAIALNVHYLNSTFTVTFQVYPNPIIQTVLSALDIFLKPTSIGSLRYSIEIIPIMIFFVFFAGLVPSIVTPYLRKFRIIGVNAVPFHKDILYTIIGAVFGITIVLSLVNVIYGFITGSQPHYYSYLLPALLGFSLHYFLGLFVGRDKAERLVEASLRAKNRKRVFIGEININNENEKPEAQN